MKDEKQRATTENGTAPKKKYEPILNEELMEQAMKWRKEQNPALHTSDFTEEIYPEIGEALKQLKKK